MKGNRSGGQKLLMRNLNESSDRSTGMDVEQRPPRNQEIPNNDQTPLSVKQLLRTSRAFGQLEERLGKLGNN